MKNPGTKLFLTGALVVATCALSVAAEPEHTGHGATTAVIAPAPVLVPPRAQALPSGKAREPGFAGPEMMETTSLENPVQVQCTQAARGLIMLDRATLAQCGAVPEPPPSTATPEHSHAH